MTANTVHAKRRAGIKTKKMVRTGSITAANFVGNRIPHVGGRRKSLMALTKNTRLVQ